MGKVEHISSLTPLRGIAALWVVLFHIDVSTYYRDLGAILPRDATGLFSKGYLWVDFFFLLSGFIIYHVYGKLFTEGIDFQKAKKYLWSRFTRIYPLHLFTLLIVLLGTLVVAHFYPQIKEDGSWTTYFAKEALPGQFLMFNAMNTYHFLSWNMPSWSIGAEWETYLLSVFFLPYLGRQNKIALVSSSLLAYFGLYFLVRLHPNHSLDITWDYGFLRCLFSFVIGVNLYRVYTWKHGKEQLSKDYVFVGLLVTIFLGFHFKFYDLIFIPLFSLLIVAAAYNNTKVKSILEKPFFEYIGKISYSIYLIHGLVFFFFWFQFPQWKVEFGWDEMPSLWRLAYIFVFLGSTILFSMFSYHFVEVKARNWLRKK
ncbi:acyltransferase [Flammeovirga pectinis]|uniref:Acyltransferase n=1 Tax=Flammeovirga pectinis TaxID=2494373 RepID=A0A3Q9FPI8_9BACT|nr:acyltransferase [Flammeovirga pectinis]AZQ61712.1 acyltransferase [Flammeovirga pectinis]